jgi:hypothetical protein
MGDQHDPGDPMQMLIGQTAAALRAAGGDRETIIAAIRRFLDAGMAIVYSPSAMWDYFRTTLDRAGFNDEEKDRRTRIFSTVTNEVFQGGRPYPPDWPWHERRTMEAMREPAALEAAIRAGAELACVGDQTRQGYVGVAYLGRDKQLLAVGTGLTLGECLAAVNQDCAAGGKTAKEFESAHSPVCALDRLAPTGSPDAVSALDGYLLAPNRGFAVRWHEGQFRLTARWWRKVSTPREFIQEVIREQVPLPWQHGDFTFETVPLQGKANKLFAHTRTKSRPAGSKHLYPTEERQIAVLGGSLADVLANAEGPIAAALREDEEWYRLTRRCT